MRLCLTGSMPLHTTNHISMLVLWSYDETMFYRKHTLTYHYLISMTVLWSYDETMFYRKHTLTYHYLISMTVLWSYDEALFYRKHTLTYHYLISMTVLWSYDEALFYRKHTLTYHYLISMTVLWSYDETMSYRKHTLTYHQPHLYVSLMILWWDYVLQEAYPYIPLPHLYDSLMILWRGFVLQEAYPYIPLPHLYDSLMILWWDYVLQEACPYITQATSLWQPYDPMMRLCFTGSMPLHTTNLISMTVLWSNDETMFYRKHALTYHKPRLYDSLVILWWGYVLQEAYPYIPQATSLWQPYDPMMRLCFTGSIPLHTTGHISMAALWSHDEAMLYRKHALTYHQPHLYDSLMIQWWDYVLQEACPYITQATSLWQPYDPMMRLCFTGSMPLHTTNLISMTVLWSNDETMFYRKHALTYHKPRLYDSLVILWWGYVLQEACPYIPLPHILGSLMILWWGYVLQEAYPNIPPTTSLWQSYNPMMRLCFTGSMPLHTTTHISMAAIWSHDEAMLYRKHALTYHQPHLYVSLMILWWDYDLQEAWPYIPPTTSLCQSNDPMMRLCFTGSMPLHTTNHVFMTVLWTYDETMFYRKHALTYHQPHLYDSLMIQWWDYVLQEACPYIPQTTSLWQSYNPMMRLCFTGSMPLHTTNLISMTVLWSNDETMFYRKHALTYHKPRLYDSLMILWWGYVLQETCPYIPPTTSLWQSNDPMMRLCFTGNMPLHTTGHISMAALWSYDEAMLYRKHALTYHQPHLYGSLMILWWDYVLQEACPYIPQATSLWQPYDPMMRLCFTGSIPLHTINHVFMTVLWWGFVLQEACPYIPPTTSLWQSHDPMMRLCFTGSMPLHTTTSPLWQSYDPMMRLCFTGSKPLHTTNHVFMTVSWSYDEAMFYRKHALTYHYLISMTVLWSYDETMSYRKHALTYHQPHLYVSLMILWWDYVLQEACPYISLPHLYDSLMILWRGFVLQEAYPYIPLPHLYDSLMILWWDYVLQEACPYIPPTTSLC